MHFMDKGQVSKASEADVLKELRAKVLPMGTGMEVRLLVKSIQARLASTKAKAEGIFYRMIDLGIVEYEHPNGRISEVSIILPSIGNSNTRTQLSRQS